MRRNRVRRRKDKRSSSERNIHCEKYAQCLDKAAKEDKRQMVCAGCDPTTINFEKSKQIEQ